MSYHEIKDLKITPNVVRDFFQIFPKSADFTIDVFQEHHVCGLDILVHNRGAASLTCTIDKQVKTVDAGDTFTWDNVKYALVEIVATDNYDLVIAGVRLAGRV